jgi:hypothetical protein
MSQRSGMPPVPVDLLSAYGAGVQLHVEDLAEDTSGGRAA